MGLFRAHVQPARARVGLGHIRGDAFAFSVENVDSAPYYGSPSSLTMPRSVAGSSHRPVTSRCGCQLRMNEKNVQKSVSEVGKPEGWSFSVVQTSHWLSTAALAASRL